MNKLTLAVLVLSSTTLLSGCVSDSANDEVSYDAYEPGYTGYTVGYGPYGIYNGYGPSFWTPGYYNNTGYNRREAGAAYYGGYRGGFAGYAGHRR